ncbi:MAG: thiopurine S-methyltransferase [Salinicola sp.]|uniref:thiopurine S-methyltransferase n=1 Tax=uncultured Salinicola sp. TaxID=1193542 RepID=UPI000C90ABE0|nr:thiopurine S-methyltransferase [uncultured Salinicola sp.]MAM56957.1 thiopurine S-methyltransferase [Salinicola sp.]
MSGTDWLQRWRQGRIGFHRESPHPALEAFWHRLELGGGAKILVPLCGKSRDMRWLVERGNPVLGIELSPLAIEQFIAEEQLVAEKRRAALRYRQSGFECTRLGRVELWCGDFFHFQVEQAAELAGFYDRAALIALPPATRQRYAHHLAQLLLPGTRGLLITLIHDDPDRGPPFSVTHAEVEALMAPNFELVLCDVAAAADGMVESVWQLTRRGPARQARPGPVQRWTPANDEPPVTSP